MSVCVFAGDQLAAYGFGKDHPFNLSRYPAFWSEFQKRGLQHHNEICLCPPVMASVSELKLFHDAEYINRVQQQSMTGVGYLDYGDTPAFKGVYEAAAYVVGSVLQAMENLITQKCKQAFVPIAGLHHARRDQAAGFCVFNDCGVVIESLLKKHHLSRVAYVDIDAHHGDGVFYAFESEPRLLFADLHEDGRYLYPGTGFENESGKGKASGTKLNIPMPPAADDQMFVQQFDKVVAFLNQYEPEFIILQCGADSLDGDPITDMQYSYHAHAYATEKLLALANKYCDGRLLCLGGGGYNLSNIADAWCAVVESLIKAES